MKKTTIAVTIASAFELISALGCTSILNKEPPSIRPKQTTQVTPHLEHRSNDTYSQTHIVSLQGSESSITENKDGVSILKISGMAPFGALLDDNIISSIEFLVPHMNKDVNAVIIQSDANKKATSYVAIKKASYSKELGVLTLSIQPIEFNEGAALKKFGANTKITTSSLKDSSSSTRVYLEFDDKVAQLGYSWCQFKCDALGAGCIAGCTSPGAGYTKCTEFCHQTQCICYVHDCNLPSTGWCD